MRTHSITVKNYRPFKVLEDMRLGQLATIVGKNVIKVIEDMSPNELLEMDEYKEDNTEHHELKEIAEKLLNLVGE